MTEPSVPASLSVRVLTILDHGLTKPRLALRQLVKALALVGVGALGGGAIVAAKVEPQVVHHGPMSELPRSHAAIGIAWAVTEFRARTGHCPASLDEVVERGIVDRVAAVNAWGEPLRWRCDDDYVLVHDRGNPDMRWDEFVAGERRRDLRDVDPDHPIPFFLRIDPREP